MREESTLKYVKCIVGFYNFFSAGLYQLGVDV
jgi:hypothetical protein